MAKKEQTRAASSGVLLPQTMPVRELHTILRDRETSNTEFAFSADRLMKLVIEHALNLLPYKTSTVTTPAQHEYKGVAFLSGNCGIAVCRSGETMEGALRECCGAIRIGKILIGDDQKVLYTRLMGNIHRRRVLLLYPTLSTGNTVTTAIRLLLETGVREERIILITLSTTQKCLNELQRRHPRVKIVTSEISEKPMSYMTTRYFGTD